MQFDNDELYEIEKMFDNEAPKVTQYLADIGYKLKQTNVTKADKIINKVFDESMEAYIMMRSISARARKMRLGEYDESEDG